MIFKKEITILYTNYRGECSAYRIIPKALKYEATQWHSEQWILYAFDVERNVMRGFALLDIEEFSESEEEV